MDIGVHASDDGYEKCGSRHWRQGMHIAFEVKKKDMNGLADGTPLYHVATSNVAVHTSMRERQ